MRPVGALVDIWGMADMWSCEIDLIRNSRRHSQLLSHRRPLEKSVDVTLRLDVATAIETIANFGTWQLLFNTYYKTRIMSLVSKCTLTLELFTMLK